MMELAEQTLDFARRTLCRRFVLAAVRDAVCCALMCAFAFATPAFGHSDNPLKPLDTSSPQATLQSFWEQSARVEAALTSYRQDQTFEQYVNCVRVFAASRDLFDLRETPRAFRLKKGGASFSYLHDVLVRLPPTEPTEFPGGPDFDPEEIEVWRYPDTEIVIRRVNEGPGQGKYLFSAETVSRLPEFHARIIHRPAIRPTDYPQSRQEVYRFTGPLFPFALTDHFPRSLRINVFGTPLWKVIVTSFIAAIIGSVTLLWLRAVKWFASNFGAAGQLASRTTVPVLLALLIYVFYEFIIALQLNVSGDFAMLVSSLVTVGITVACMWTAWLLVHLLVEAIIALPSIPEQSYDAHLLRLVARVAGVVVGVAILFWGAHELGIPAAGVIAGLGVGGFALALAAQSTVENLFGGVNIFADRPFRVGDFIHYGNADGIVEAIGPRSTRIRGLDGTLTTVPNADLSKIHITNYSMRDKCFFHHILNLRYETTPAQFEWLLRELRCRVAAHPMVEETTDMPRIRLLRFGSSSIDIDVRAYVLTTRFPDFLSIQEELLLDIIKVIGEAGSGFAFPSTTTYLSDDTGIRPDRLKPFGAVDKPTLPRGASPETDRTIDAEHHREEGPSVENIP